MQMDLSGEEQALIENYRQATKEDREAIRWAAQVAARVDAGLIRRRITWES